MYEVILSSLTGHVLLTALELGFLVSKLTEPPQEHRKACVLTSSAFYKSSVHPVSFLHTLTPLWSWLQPLGILRLVSPNPSGKVAQLSPRLEEHAFPHQSLLQVGR